MSENLVMTEPRQKGPVEILCKEIELPFHRNMEKPEVLLAFVKVLVSEVEKIREIEDSVASMTGKPPSAESAIVLEKVRAMLACVDLVERARLCADLHAYIDDVAPEESYPCDHLIDMLNSCVSAVRFGFETPCMSRHTAAAAGHIWEQRYGISCQDEHTGRWRRDWARAKFQDALVLLWLSSDTKARP